MRCSREYVEFADELFELCKSVVILSLPLGAVRRLRSKFVCDSIMKAAVQYCSVG